VVRTASFTAAARELGYTQSAVSQQIASLEEETGCRLLERRPVRPTPAGARLAEHATRILLRLDVARSELTAHPDLTAKLRVDVCPLAAPDLLADGLRALRRSHPTVRISVRAAEVAEAVGAVAAGHAGAALVDGITAADSPLGLADAGLLASTALAEVPLVVVLPDGHPLRTQSTLDLDTLRDAPWIVAPSLSWPAITDAGVGGPVVYEGRDLATLLSLVRAGHGVALLPDGPWAAGDGIICLPLRHPALVHRTEVVTLRNPAPVVEHLTEALRSRSPISRWA
jgi:DNA-binding transcriptional LysR family regulator